MSRIHIGGEDHEFLATNVAALNFLGELRDCPCGNRLRFLLKLDQSYLPPFLSDLDRAIVEYPVIGSPRSR
jgi:hypothetical protein